MAGSRTLHAIYAVTTAGVAGKLPHLAIAVGCALLAFAAVRQDGFFPWDGPVPGSIAITTLVVLRQVLVQSETTESAETDRLTNRATAADCNKPASSAY